MEYFIVYWTILLAYMAYISVYVLSDKILLAHLDTYGDHLEYIAEMFPHDDEMFCKLVDGLAYKPRAHDIIVMMS